MHLIATVLSTRYLGYYVEIVSDGTLFIGAFAFTKSGGADFIPGTGSRSLEETLSHIERQLLGEPSSRYCVPQSPRSDDEMMELREECQRDGFPW